RCDCTSAARAASCRGATSASTARSTWIIYRSWRLSMMRGAMTRRHDRSVDLQLHRSNVAARTERTALTALVDGEVRAAQAEAAGGIASFDGSAGDERNVCQGRAAVDPQQSKSRRDPGQIGGDQTGAAIGAADQ